MANELPYSSEVAFYKGVPFDKSYQHTIYFKNKNNQYIYFHSKLAYSFTNLSYQRINRNTIRVSRRFEDLNGCNYLSIKNGENDKTYYCFVDEVNYISDDVSEVTYTIDIMQTYLFDYNLGQCWVDRQHSNSDELGENLTEDIFWGEYTNNGSPSDIELAPSVGVRAVCEKNTATYPEATYTYTNNSLKYAIVLAFTTDIYSHNLNEDATVCNVYDKIPAGICLIGIPYDDNINKILWGVLNSRFGGQYNSYKHLQFASIVPFNRLHIKNDKWYYDKAYNIDTETFSTYVPYFYIDDTLYDSFQHEVAFPSSLDGYTPSNNKMFSFPYVYQIVSNQTGVSREYKLEDIGSPSSQYYEPKFTVYGYFTGGSVTFNLLPNVYEGVNKDVDKAVTLAELPFVSWGESGYGNWLEKNMSQTLTHLAFSLVKAGVSTATGNVMGAVSGFEGAMSAGISHNVASLLPNTLSGDATNSFALAKQAIRFRIVNRSLKSEFAKQIDDYFTMYGYAQKKTATPNRCTRKFWTYVKTKGCVIKPTGNGMTSQIQKRLADIYDNGITFWRYDGVDAPNPDVANYNQNNEILD